MFQRMVYSIMTSITINIYIMCPTSSTITLLISESSLKGPVLQQSVLLLELDNMGQPIAVLLWCLHENFVQSLVFQLP